MATQIVIARHGNTFTKGQIPTRVGATTDLPLVEEHRATSIGHYLRDKKLTPHAVYAAPLQRTLQTATLAIKAFGGTMQPIIIERFKEIDYGPDENKTEQEVIRRLGKGDIAKGRAIIDAWNTNATVPEGWNVNPNAIIENWKGFANTMEKQYPNHTILVISSNGIIRFAPHLTANFKTFAQQHPLKVSTGGICIFEKKATDLFWNCTAWNEQPYKHYPKAPNPIPNQ